MLRMLALIALALGLGACNPNSGSYNRSGVTTPGATGTGMATPGPGTTTTAGSY